MIEVKAGMTMCQLVDAFLDRKTPPVMNDNYSQHTRHGVIIRLDVDITSYTDDETFGAREYINFLFTGNTSVFVAPGYGTTEYGDWKNTSNHDSCWRSDGTDRPLSELYFNMCDSVNEQRVAAGLEKIAPCEMSQFSHFFTPLVKHVDVTTMYDKDTFNPSYFRKIVDLQYRK